MRLLFAIGRGSAASGMLGKLVRHVFDGQTRRLVAHLIEDGALDRDREEIRAMLDSPPRKPSKKGGWSMSFDLADSPARRAAWWTMLHLVWIAAVAWLILAPLRRLLRRASAEVRHGVAVVVFLAFSVAPIALFAWICRPAHTVRIFSLPDRVITKANEHLRG